MKLQGRNLSIQAPPLEGEEVKLLQSELQRLGYAIPAAEVAASSFGAGTSNAVESFRAKNGLTVTNTVDQATAEKIRAAVDGCRIRLKSFLFKGQIPQSDGTEFVGAVVRAADKELRSEIGLAETTTGNVT